MGTEKSIDIKNGLSRLMVSALLLVIQIIWFVVIIQRLNEYSMIISSVSAILAAIVVLTVYGRQENSAFKMPWIILILIFPIFGLCLYFLFGTKIFTKKMRNKFNQIDEVLFPHLIQKKEVIDQLAKENKTIANQASYILNYGKFPMYQNTDVKFFADAKEGFDAQLAQMELAKEFIFMEYHAIQEAESFSRLKDVLGRKAKEGVEVRILYDDIGSIGFINHDFVKRMKALGIQCRVFNPVSPFMNVFVNNRDHRKITVIDGKVGFTGGYNLADEYFNIVNPFGHWKDTGIMLTGEAIKSLTIMFLEMWNAIKVTDTKFEQYLNSYEHQASENVYIQPYADSPLDNEYLGENVYMNQIKGAQTYFYAITPYLILSDEMTRELTMAAQRGVDVRIITPGIPDKKLVYGMTRSYYAALARKGVRVYEYTPGFVHCKQTICDDTTAVVGTINMDFRSLYHHFENGVLLYGGSVIQDIKKDFEDTIEKSNEVTTQYSSERSSALRITQCMLRLVAPLL